MKWTLPAVGAGLAVTVAIIALLLLMLTGGGTCGGQAPAGGTLTYAELETLWDQADGPPAAAPTAAAIALAESGGKNVIQPNQPYATRGWGIFQITPGNSEPQFGIDQALLDPLNNARAAVAKYRAANGFTPWTTYTSGAYLAFLQPTGPQSLPVSLSLATGTACAATGPGGYVNPLARATGITWERTDEGVDASMTVGSPIVALGDSTVKIITPFYQGEPAIILRLDGGPLAGDVWYISEQITPAVVDGETVQAGKTVATYAPSGTGIELGWWQPGPGSYPLGRDYGGTAYKEGDATAPGADFRYLLEQLGANPGTGAGLSSGVTLGARDYP